MLTLVSVSYGRRWCWVMVDDVDRRRRRVDLHLAQWRRCVVLLPDWERVGGRGAWVGDRVDG